MKATAIAVAFLIALLAVTAVAEEHVRPYTGAAEPSSARPLEQTRHPGTPGQSAPCEDRYGPTSNAAPPGAPRAADPGFLDPPCELECHGCAYGEGEGPCYDEYLDVVNGGCNSIPPVFHEIAPEYGRITICGMSGTYLFGGWNYRDTDWYQIDLADPAEISFCCTAEFPVQMNLIALHPDCSYIETIHYELGDACQEVCIHWPLDAGTYYLFVAPQDFSGLDCDLTYIMTIDGYYAGNCILDCPGGAMVEEEPECGPEYIDEFNAGCNWYPESFWHIEPSVSKIWTCGTSGVYPIWGNCYRDTDWYEIVLDEPREIEFCAAAEFPILMFMLQPDPDCSNLIYIDYDSADPCMDLCLTQPLDPGTYYLWVGPSYWGAVDCGRRYIFTVDGFTTPVNRMSWGMIKGLYR